MRHTIRTGLALATILAATTAAEPTPVSAGTDSAVALTAPDAAESFMFIVFGDRTGGPRSGIKVLAKAVETTRWLDPDFVMTVGDLVEGYNTPDEWLTEMTEYKGIMDALPMPWYPVAGNHDVYARPNLPGGHTNLYKQHFAPLYYSFNHKFAHFIVLFSDESLAFSDPSKNQNMSPEQLDWLKTDLASTKAERVFVFLHHPRWLQQYEGSNWPQVHQLFVDDARPTTVIAGHIHAIRDDGRSDNVQYLTLGTVGGHPERELSHSSINHVTLVHVRHDRESVVHIPMDSVRPASDFPGWESDEIMALNRAAWVDLAGRTRIASAAGEKSTLTLTLTNPTTKTLETGFAIDAPKGWELAPSDGRATLAPGQSVRWDIQATAPALGDTRPEVVARVRALYPLTMGQTETVSLRLPVQVDPAVGAVLHDHTHATPNGVLSLDGRSALKITPPARPDQFTLEAWVKGSAPKGRQGLICNTESSGFGIFWSDDADGSTLPAGYSHTGSDYVAAHADQPWDWARWTHLALVKDATHLRLFINGRQTDAQPADAVRHNNLPLFVGADTDANANPTAFWPGLIDELRFSSVARYSENFSPARRHEADPDTLVLMHFDDDLGIVFPDASGRESHAWAHGSPSITRESLPD